MINYSNKYLKYKKKYDALKKIRQTGGVDAASCVHQFDDLCKKYLIVSTDKFNVNDHIIPDKDYPKYLSASGASDMDKVKQQRTAGAPVGAPITTSSICSLNTDPEYAFGYEGTDVARITTNNWAIWPIPIFGDHKNFYKIFSVKGKILPWKPHWWNWGWIPKHDKGGEVDKILLNPSDKIVINEANPKDPIYDGNAHAKIDWGKVSEQIKSFTGFSYSCQLSESSNHIIEPYDQPIKFHIDGNYIRLHPHVGKEGASYKIGCMRTVYNTAHHTYGAITNSAMLECHITNVYPLELNTVSLNEIHKGVHSFKLTEIDEKNLVMHVKHNIILTQNYVYRQDNCILTFGPSSSSMYKSGVYTGTPSGWKQHDNDYLFIQYENDKYEMIPLSNPSDILFYNKKHENDKTIESQVFEMKHGHRVGADLEDFTGMTSDGEGDKFNTVERGSGIAYIYNNQHSPIKCFGLLQVENKEKEIDKNGKSIDIFSPYGSTQFWLRTSILYNNIKVKNENTKKPVKTGIYLKCLGVVNDTFDNIDVGLILTEDLPKDTIVSHTYDVLSTIDVKYDRKKKHLIVGGSIRNSGNRNKYIIDADIKKSSEGMPSMIINKK